MTVRAYAITSSIIFLVVAILHLLRLVERRKRISRTGMKVNHERRIREKSQDCRRRWMVGCLDRRRISYRTLARLPCRHEYSAWVDACHVGTRCQLGVLPECLFVGHGDIQVLCLDDGIGGTLADAVGKAVA